ncbi:MAG: ATP-binding protein, partial [Halanaerobium sp.]
LELAKTQEGKVARGYLKDARELREAAEKISDKVKVKKDKDKTIKVEKEKGNIDDGKRWMLSETPEETFDDVAGLYKVKKELKNKVIDPFVYPDIYEKFGLKIGGGILMYGPPGTGKTLISRAVAGELDAKCFIMQAEEIKNKYYGETEKNLKKLFSAARQYDRSVILLDDCENLITKRGNRQRSKVNTFLRLTDGITTGMESKNKCLLFMGATNRPWMIDEAALRPNRLGTHIYVGLPDLDSRKKIIELNMEGIPVTENVSFLKIADKTEKYSGADLSHLCDKVKNFAAERVKNKRSKSGNNGDKSRYEILEKVTMDDFKRGLEEIQPSVSRDLIERYKNWRENR